MRKFNIEEVKSQLDQLVAEAASGAPFLITSGDTVLVKVAGYETSTERQRSVRRLGFMAGQMRIPAHFDALDGDEIVRIFGDEP